MVEFYRCSGVVSLVTSVDNHHGTMLTLEPPMSFWPSPTPIGTDRSTLINQPEEQVPIFFFDILVSGLINQWHSSGKKVIFSVGGQNGNWGSVFQGQGNM